MNGADLLRHYYDELLALLVTEIAQAIPGFNDGIENARHPLRRQRQAALRLSLTGMIHAIDERHGIVVEPMDWSEHVELGRMERRYGRPLGQILRAPWVASRTIIRFVNDRAADFGISVDACHETNEIVVEWSDRISIEFSEGYNDETAARSSQLEARRHHLLRTVLADTAPTDEALQAAAQAANWRPAPRIRVLVARGPERDHYRRRLPSGSIAADLDDELVALIPAAHATTIRHGPADDAVAALGPPTPIGNSAYSARLARRSFALASGRSRPEFIDSTNCELDLVAFADFEAAEAFSHRLLQPIEDNSQLVETLYAWLCHHGRPQATAHALGIHPNTVNYRMNQIRERVGSAIDSPDHRLDLYLASHIAVSGATGLNGETQ